MNSGSHTRTSRRATALLAVMVSACAFSGCDRSTAPGVGLGPGPVLPGGLAITAPRIASSSVALCATRGLLTTDLNVVVSSTGAGLFVDQVSLHLIDGTNIGGPAVTFPQADLNARFANTVVVAGSSRTFGLTPTFTCGRSAPRSIHGVVGVVDAHGRRSVMTASVTLP